MTLTTQPVARATMLIRKPIADVFNAFIDPDITNKFWFSRASGPLTVGQTVTWYWDHYGVSAEVLVKDIQTHQRIEIEWPTPVEWVFTTSGDQATFVCITAAGFTGTDDEKVAEALASTEGFNLVISACKAYLEYGIELNLVRDKNPAANKD